MRSSITYKASRDRVVIGTNVEYAAKNQKYRPFLGVSDGDRVEIMEIIEAELNEP